ncbi:zinc phosphodiesterase ELAC protein 2-like isoform X2 [Nicotiana tabacum]|uniref:ribonuclease Z n=4 Tax=Nicotiana tabacum TaxID=4097 RepID=A7WPK6_TOBAC|nr:zinc phosphodiesterase ELAC protein 2-like [Nicotiana tabacum]CAO99120.1 putative hydrolase [Nicotiana tabacum]
MSRHENNVRQDVCGSTSRQNTEAYVQILGTGMDTQETSPSVLLFFNNERFIFNAGEGLQRFCAEHKIKLSQVDHICLTRVCSETAGGLPGLLLSLAGIKNGSPESTEHVDIWGPPNLDLLVNAMKNFVPHATMVKAHIIPRSDNVMVHGNGAALASSLHAEELQAEGKFKAVSISAILLTPTHLDGSHFSSNDTSIVYICNLHDIRGEFDPRKAKACGLKKGRKLGQLQNGISVKSDLLDIEVHPDDVIGPPIPGPIVLIVDCPTEPHAQELLSAQALNAYYSDSQSNSQETTKVVNCIIHLSPATVVSSPVYEKWMRKFGSAQHIMARTTRKHETTPILESSARIATRLHYLCPQLFPAPSLFSVQNDDVAAPNFKGSISKVCGISAENLLKFTLRPPRRLGLDRSSVQNRMTSSVFVKELLSEIPEIADAAKNISTFWHKPKEDEADLFTRQDSEVMTGDPSLAGHAAPRCLDNVQRDDLEIVFLGTGSSIPSKYRNVSSIYFNLFSKGGLLLDCGEGSLAQLKRRYGINGADSAVRNLKCIWISHIHADHHAGLARILALRRDLLKGVPHEPMLVIGPEQVGEFLKDYKKLEDLDMLFLDCRSTTVAKWDDMEADSIFDKDHQMSSEGMNDESRDHSVLTCLSEDSSLLRCSKRMKPSTPVDDIKLLKHFKKVLSEAGLVRFISFPVVHCPGAFGIILESAERMNCGKVVPGWKVVYSGDTRPCSEVIEASLGATILIHEATFEDGLLEEAITRNHSTIKEAIEVGRSAGAYRIILTHFSQRYPKVPALDEVSMQRTCIAFDLMSVNLADLQLLPKVLPYLKLLFRTME